MSTIELGDMAKKDVCIVIPVYKEVMDENEKKSFLQCRSVLGVYDICLVAPQGLDTGAYIAPASGAALSANPVSVLKKSADNIRIELFGKSFFDGIEGYNRLMLTPEFYQRFESYRYILICQLDAWVFRNELDMWVAKDYDYIGAPWIPTKNKYFTVWGKAVLFFNRIFRKNDGRTPHNTFLYGVGNGGFSLRKVDKFIKLTTSYKDRIAKDLTPGEKLYPEDLWLFYAPKGPDRLRTPHWKEALEFAFEQNPDKSYKINGGRLPFGCHAWYHRNYSHFWEKFI